ncbi:hypothetical protein HYT01_03265 [Candidatus Giovannonibacteria bacterium]|nr:hypothetical protein [Candidatus Giovannonibacteria bacterium]
MPYWVLIVFSVIILAIVMYARLVYKASWALNILHVDLLDLAREDLAGRERLIRRNYLDQYALAKYRIRRFLRNANNTSGEGLLEAQSSKWRVEENILTIWSGSDEIRIPINDATLALDLQNIQQAERILRVYIKL